MKKFISIGLPLLLGSLSLCGQSINGVLLKDIDAKYIMVVGIGSVFRYDIRIHVDFGKRVDALVFKDKEMAVKDEKGENVEFNSMVEALNFFDKNGYDFVNAYSLTETSGFGKPQNVLNWILRKR